MNNQQGPAKVPPSILGLSTDALAGLSPDELNNNPVAIKMLLHYYRQLVEENNALKNDNNTLKTYVDAYDRQRRGSSIGVVLMGASNVSVGFGVNLLTAAATWPGVVSLLSGIGMAAAGFYITLWRRA